MKTTTRKMSLKTIEGRKVLTIVDRTTTRYYLFVETRGPRTNDGALLARRSIKCVFVKFPEDAKPEEKPYEAEFHIPTQSGTCTCLGHKMWHHRGTVCKHIAAVVKLYDLGKI